MPPRLCDSPGRVWALSVPMEAVLLWQPRGAGPTLGMGCGRQWVFVEKVYFYFFIFFSEGTWCYSVESSLQVEFLGSSAVVCLHLKIWPFIWKQTWASSSSFIQAVLFQGQGVRPAQLNAAASSWMFPNKMPWVSLFFPLKPKFSALEKLLWQSVDGNDDKINLWIVLGRFGKCW